MSTTSRQRTAKSPNPNARQALRQHAAKAASYDAPLGCTAVEAMPGHADRHLVPGMSLGGLTVPKPVTKGAFGRRNS